MTAQQWGDLVRGMYPGYSGHRPRVQLFHGDADATISYKNFGEAIKEWTNVLGLSTNPTSTTTGLTLGTHQATRQQWKDSCGYVVLDAFTSIGGDHGPSDALFNAGYVIPFLGLDNTGATDPQIAQCAGGGAGGAGGSVADGGSRDSGGAQGSGGGRGSGGAGGGGGAPGAGGQPGTGGSSAGGSGGVTSAADASMGATGGMGSGGSGPAVDLGGGCSCAFDSARSGGRAGVATAALLGLALWALTRRRRRAR
jgi:hypothetical protein